MFTNYNPESSRITTSGPLLVVFIVNIIRKGLEDWKRHKADSQQNNKIALIYDYSSQTFQERPWYSIEKGEIIKIRKQETVPADILILTTSEEGGKCFAETSDLDGETNLKKKESNQHISSLVGYREIGNPQLIEDDLVAKIPKIIGMLIYESPNSNLYSFNGSFQSNNESYGLTHNNTIWRGSSLRSCDWIYGIVLYTGHDTRIIHSSKKSPAKQSNVYRKVNILIFIIFALELIVILISTITYLGFTQNPKKFSYLFYPENFKPSFDSFLTFLILYNNFVPISLYVSLDFVKYFQSNLMEFDDSMKDPETGTRMKVRTAEINENLGQVEYIFTDKTGTLTRNVMEMKKIVVDDKIYGYLNTEKPIDKNEENLFFTDPTVTFYDPELLREIKKKNVDVDKFFICVSLCHTVIPEFTSVGVEFRASSPDEIALVKVKNLLICSLQLHLATDLKFMVFHLN